MMLSEVLCQHVSLQCLATRYNAVQGHFFPMEFLCKRHLTMFAAENGAHR